MQTPLKPLPTPELIAELTGAKLPAVQAALKPIIDALCQQSIYTRTCLIATLATVMTECGFRPVQEAYWLSEAKRRQYCSRYDGRKDLGNTQPGDGYKYRGRGFIQLTGRHNYQVYGEAIGVDLVNNPDKALEPTTAAKILAVYFVWRKVNKAAAIGDWEKTRRLVNGGLNGWQTYKHTIDQLIAGLGDIG